MINDYYGVTHLDLTSASALHELSLIFKVYNSSSVSRLHLMLNYDPSVSVEFTLSLAKSYYNAIKPIIPKRLNISLMHTVPLVQGVSTVAELPELALNISGRKYIYLTIPFDIKTDDAVSELHNLIYKRHLTPIIVAFEN